MHRILFLFYERNRRQKLVMNNIVLDLLKHLTWLLNTRFHFRWYFVIICNPKLRWLIILISLKWWKWGAIKIVNVTNTIFVRGWSGYACASVGGCKAFQIEVGLAVNRFWIFCMSKWLVFKMALCPILALKITKKCSRI